jgi:hypothetical protein
MYQRSKCKSKNFKTTKENIGKTLENIGIGHSFLDKTLIPQSIRTRIEKWDSIKL